MNKENWEINTKQHSWNVLKAKQNLQKLHYSGFLSLICRKSSSEFAEELQRKRGEIPNPQTGTTKQSLKETTPSNKDDRESCSFPSRSTSSFVQYDNIAADAVVVAPHNEPSDKPPHRDEDREKEEEPTKISEYFFSDIFMEVDDPE